MSEKVNAPVGDKQIIIETGKLAKQADGAVTVQLGETIVIVAAVGAVKAKEVQDQCIVLSADGENDPDMLALVGASASLMVSDIPWEGPIGAARIGRINGQFVANPTHAQMLESDLDVVYVGNETDLVMFEGSGKEISEADFNAALKFGHEAIQPTILAQKELAVRVGNSKRQIKLNIVPEE